MKLICGIVGSLRRGSFNRGLMNAAIEVGRDAGLDIQIFDRIGEIPIYNADLDKQDALPAPVNALKNAIGSASVIGAT
ncbi:MAG: NAD(P)H-dependent oxidoreductase [Gemmatimonadaceae bacterium]